MTFNIPTASGIIEINAPFPLKKRDKDKIRKIFAEIPLDNKPLPSEAMESFLKRTTPEAKTPIGKVKGLLALYGWNQKMLSKKSKLAVSIICDILKGRRVIGVATAKKLAKPLNIDYRELL